MDKFNEEGQNTNLKRYYDGASPDDLWAVRSAGIDPATGQEIFIKKDGSYTYDFSFSDEVKVGTDRPKIEGVFGSLFTYKGFSVSDTGAADRCLTVRCSTKWKISLLPD